MKGSMNSGDCLVLILGGGKGTRLFPLTLERSKPAIGFGGKYRLIDIPLSNCINSGYNKVFILTQFLSASLHGHILHTYQFDNFSKGFVEILSAEQSHKNSEWFQGTADAVRRVLRHLCDIPQENVLILSGDHLYKMDYRKLLDFHAKKNADVTVASIFVDDDQVFRLGVLDCDSSGRMNRLVEKPSQLSRLKIKPKTVKISDKIKNQYLASMGIYVFKKNILFEILNKTKADDFGTHILPFMIKNNYKVYSYKFKGYWRDIGTIKSYYQASMDLIAKRPAFDLFDDKWPLFTRARFLPPSKINDSNIINTLIADGCCLEKVKIENSIIGLRNRIMENTRIRDSVIIGNDYYQRKSDKVITPRIGKGVVIERAIIDKNVTIGDFCYISDKLHAPDSEGEFYCVRDGITVIKRGAVILPHTKI